MALEFGLNGRTSGEKRGSGTGKREKRRRQRSVLDSGGSSSESEGVGEDGAGDGRRAANREIAAEQAALRKRAERAYAAATSGDGTYDYDGQYESFASGAVVGDKSSGREERPLDAAAKRSRYVSSLLKTAESRKRDQELVRERRIARELKEEEGKEEFFGKEKFVTKAYKRRLEEREKWEREGKDLERRDMERGQGDGAEFGVAGLLRSVAMGKEGGTFGGKDVDIVDKRGDTESALHDAGDNNGEDPPSSQLSNPTGQAIQQRYLVATIEKGTLTKSTGAVHENISEVTNEEIQRKRREDRKQKVLDARKRFNERNQQRLIARSGLIPLV